MNVDFFDTMSKNISRIALLAAFLLACLLSSRTLAQTDKPSPTPAQKAEQIINRATEAFGGSKYLSVRSIIGRGFFSQFRDGMSQTPSRFVDYIVFPNKERTEFRGAARIIQTNVGDQGWIFDGAAKTISDQKPEQIENFNFGLKTSIDTLLRGTWRQEGAKLSYSGRREAGVGKRNETVRLTWPDSFWIEYEFSAQTGLPAKVIYLRSRKNGDSEVLEEVSEEDHLAQPITIDGITAPWVIDHFIGGKQTSRLNYESIEYNKSIPESLFAKPATIKGLK
jgi:hypothetical protein